MAQQVINVGNAPDDGKGDKLRPAFQKVNANFTELYAEIETGGGTGSVTQVNTGTGLTGGPITTTGTIALANTSVSPGSYISGNFTVDAQGRLTAASNGTGGGGGVSSVTAGTGLTGGTITTSGTIALANTAVVPGGYTNANITVDAQGRLIAAANGTGAGGGLPAGGTVSQEIHRNSAGAGVWTASLDSINVMDFGAIANGASHPLSSIYGSLAAAQAVYPWVDDLTPEVDTCAIQSAIDYAYNNTFSTIAMPNGGYFISQPIFLDPPGSLRNQPTIARYSAATTYASGTIVQYNGIPWISLQNGNVGHTPFFVTSDPTTGIVPPASTWWRSYYSTTVGNPVAALNQVLAWTPMLMGTPRQVGDSANWGTRLFPQFVNGQALIMGTNNGGSAANIQIQFPFEYVAAGILTFGGNNPYKVGVAIAGGGGGASRTVLENIGVSNAYVAFLVGQPGTGGLADNNVLKRCQGTFCYAFYWSVSSQTFINELFDCWPGSTVGIVSPRGTLSVFGGNWSALQEGSPSNSFTISSTSTFSIGSGGGYWPLGAALTPGAQYLNISTTVTAPDANLISSSFTDGRNGIYNTFIINTPSFGPVPFVCFPGGFNAGSRVLSLMVHPPWADTFLYIGDLLTFVRTTTNLEAEVRAATTIYAACMVFPFQCSVNAYGVFFENANTSMCLASNQNYGPSIFTGMYFDADPTLSFDAPRFSPSPAALAHYYASKTVPFIHMIADIVLDSCSFSDSGGNIRDPLIAYSAAVGFNVIYRNSACQSRSGTSPPMNFWSGYNQGGWFYSNAGPQLASSGLGGNWISPSTPNIPTWNNAVANSAAKNWAISGGTTPMTGIRPAGWSVPELLGSDFLIISNPQSLPAITSTVTDGSRAVCGYPLIYGGQTYQTSFLSPTSLVDHGGLPGNFLFESNHDFYSYHQDLTSSNVSGLHWSAEGKSWCVFVDDNTMSFMFPGLTIGLVVDPGFGKLFYVVTGTYPGLGFITVTYVHGAFTLFGVKGTPYTGTTISAQPYRIRVLSAPVRYLTTTAVAVAGQEILADTTGGAWTLTLPLNPVQGDKVTVRDATGNFAVANLTLGRNGANINSAAADLVMSTANQVIYVEYINGTIGWKTYAT